MLIYWFVNMLAGGMLAGTALLLSQFIHKRMSVVFIPFIVYSYMAYLFGGQAQYERFSLKSVINMSEGAITVTAEYTAVMFASVTLVTFLVYYVVGYHEREDTLTWQSIRQTKQSGCSMGTTCAATLSDPAWQCEVYSDRGAATYDEWKVGL